MALKIRMSRQGTKKRPFYHIVVTDSRSPRDGNFIEKIGSYNPMLLSEDENRVKIDLERAKYWLGVGATPSERVASFLSKSKLVAAPEKNAGPKKSAPKAIAQERLKALAEKAQAPEAPAAEAKAE